MKKHLFEMLSIITVYTSLSKIYAINVKKKSNAFLENCAWDPGMLMFC